jgi:hypothetical protein
MPAQVMVFSHPNHEIALWASIRDVRPIIVFLTDGGGEDRMNQSRRGLASLVDAGQVHFLAHPEAAFYEALLRRDVPFFRCVADQVAELAEDAVPDTIYCDCVEFYNPVHDISLPIALAAFPASRARFFEVPLMHQTSAGEERYELLRVPEALAARAIWRDLSDDETQSKRRDFASHYTILVNHLGPQAAERAVAHSHREQIIPARTTLPEPVAGQVVRYERRGELLKRRGEVPEIISYRRHYAPVFEALASSGR